jgi:hypothetical protein
MIKAARPVSWVRREIIQIVLVVFMDTHILVKILGVKPKLMSIFVAVSAA